MRTVSAEVLTDQAFKDLKLNLSDKNVVVQSIVVFKDLTVEAPLDTETAQYTASNRHLRQVAQSSQARVLDYLYGMKSTHRGVTYNSIWLNNVVTLSCPFFILEQLPYFEEIESIILNSPVTLSSTFTAETQSIEKQALQLLNSTNDLLQNAEFLGLGEARSRSPERTGKKIPIGIIDGNFDLFHPALYGRVKLSKISTSSDSAYNSRALSHGTHIASVIGGRMMNGKIMGIAPESELILYAIPSAHQVSSLIEALLALQWMADPDQDPYTLDHPKIIHGSWSLNTSPADIIWHRQILCKATDALVSLNILPVFPVGDLGRFGSFVYPLPASCPSVLAVGSVNYKSELSNFSSASPSDLRIMMKVPYTLKPDVVALGENIFGAMAHNSYSYLSGTALASAQVAAAAALILEIEPYMNVKTLRRIVELSSADLGPTGFDRRYGWGIVRYDLMLETLGRLKFETPPIYEPPSFFQTF